MITPNTEPYRRLEGRPGSGTPGAPTLVRCADEEVAYQIAKIIPDARVQFGGTHGVFEFFDELAEQLESFEDVREKLAQDGLQVIGVGPINTDTIREAGLEPTKVVLNEETEEKLAEAILGDY